MNKEPKAVVDASNNCTAFMDGPNGRATRIVVFASRDAMEKGDAPLVALDFESRQLVVDWFSINLQMTSKVLSLLKAGESRNN